MHGAVLKTIQRFQLIQNGATWVIINATTVHFCDLALLHKLHWFLTCCLIYSVGYHFNSHTWHRSRLLVRLSAPKNINPPYLSPILNFVIFWNPYFECLFSGRTIYLLIYEAPPFRRAVVAWLVPLRHFVQFSGIPSGYFS